MEIEILRTFFPHHPSHFFKFQFHCGKYYHDLLTIFAFFFLLNMLIAHESLITFAPSTDQLLRSTFISFFRFSFPVQVCLNCCHFCHYRILKYFLMMRPCLWIPPIKRSTSQHEISAMEEISIQFVIERSIQFQAIVVVILLALGFRSKFSTSI